MGARARSRTTTLSLAAVGFVVSAVFTYLAVRQAVRALRWQYLFPAATRPTYRPVLEATLLGQFFNNVLPARAGEAARVIALNRSAGTAATEVAATVVVERLYDVIALLAMLFVVLPWLPEVTWVHAASILAIALVVLTAAGVVVLVRYGERPARWLLRPFARLPFVSAEQTERAAASIHRGAASLYDPALAFIAMTLTIVSWILLALSAWVLMLGFNLGLCRSRRAGDGRGRARVGPPVLTRGGRGLPGGGPDLAEGVRDREVGGALLRARPPRGQLLPVRPRGRGRPPRPGDRRQEEARLIASRPRLAATARASCFASIPISRKVPPSVT